MNRKERNEEYYKNHREEILKRTAQYQKDHPEDTRKNQKRWYENNKDHSRRYQIQHLYGLSYEDWFKMWESQDGKCAICGRPFTEPSDACVDHNHETGETRGLLCTRCNLGLGYMEDSEFEIKATEYLLRRGTI